MKRRILLLVVLLSAASASGAAALSPISEFRPRAGMGYEPDGVVAGLQILTRVRLAGLRLAPSADVGFVDGGHTTAWNLDLLTETLRIPGSGLGLYGGAGATLAAYGDGFDHSDFGFTLVLGADVGRRLFTEARFGMEDMPELRVLAGLRLLLR